MTGKKTLQSDYMSLQLMEIENFRLSLSQYEHKNISFRDAMYLWYSHGYADSFKDDYKKKKIKEEPAIA